MRSFFVCGKSDNKSNRGEQMEKRKTIAVYSQRLAGYLMQRGFVLVRLIPDQYDAKKHNFVFGDSDNLLRAMEDYRMEKQNRCIEQTQSRQENL